MLSFALTAVMVVISYLVCSIAKDSSGPVAVAFIITFVDAVLPCLVREACSLERHHNAVSHDLSFMNKVLFLNSSGTEFSILY